MGGHLVNGCTFCWLVSFFPNGLRQQRFSCEEKVQSVMSVGSQGKLKKNQGKQTQGMFWDSVLPPPTPPNPHTKEFEIHV